jgi:DNA-binding IclR family transcriptional regulator
MNMVIPGRGYGRTAKLLAEVAGNPAGISATELARRIQTPKSTLLLMLRHFREIGFVRLEQGRVRVGPRLVQLAFRVIDGFSIREYVRPHLEFLAHIAGEDIYLAIQSEQSVINIARFGASNDARIHVPLGEPRPMHATAAGKVFLAFGGDGLLESLARNGKLEKYTARTITSPGKLQKEILKIRRQGHAVNDGEATEGVYALGVPILHRGMAIGAITISGIRAKAIKNRDKHLALMTEARERIDRDLEGL